MTITIPTTEPTRIHAGATVAWTKTLGDYPASDGWELSYRLTNRDAHYDITTSADGSAHAVAISSATTAAYIPGDYQLVSWVAKASDRYFVASTAVNVQPDLSRIEGYDGRSIAAKTLEKMDEALLRYSANAWKQSYTIEGRTMTFRSTGGFFAMRSRLQAEVKNEDRAERLRDGKASRNKIRVRI